VLFFDSDETIQHLFFDYALAKFIWRVTQKNLDYQYRTILNMCSVVGSRG
jgi:hypothetical protein